MKNTEIKSILTKQFINIVGLTIMCISLLYICIGTIVQNAMMTFVSDGYEKFSKIFVFSQKFENITGGLLLVILVICIITSVLMKNNYDNFGSTIWKKPESLIKIVGITTFVIGAIATFSGGLLIFFYGLFLIYGSITLSLDINTFVNNVRYGKDIDISSLKNGISEKEIVASILDTYPNAKNSIDEKFL